MPNFDGGHYFLTALIPIRSNEFIDREGKKTSPVHLLREELAILPKARQSPVSEKNQLNSPFARNTRTHFARFVVIDDAIYNGRNPTDALKVAVGSPPRAPAPTGRKSSIRPPRSPLIIYPVPICFSLPNSMPRTERMSN